MAIIELRRADKVYSAQNGTGLTNLTYLRIADERPVIALTPSLPLLMLNTSKAVGREPPEGQYLVSQSTHGPTNEDQIHKKLRSGYLKPVVLISEPR